MTAGLFGYDTAGRVFALAHAAELLVHDGSSEAPLVRKSLAAPIVQVEVRGDEILVLTCDGGLVRLGLDGREKGRSALGADARCMSVRGDGTVAVAHPTKISTLRRGDLVPSEIPREGVSALAFNGDASRLLIATEAGVIELSTTTWEEASEPIDLDHEVTSIAWSTAGKWLVACGDEVLGLEPGESEAVHVRRARGHLVREVAASQDGKRFAMRLGDDIVVALDDPPTDTIGQLVYPQTRVTGIAFGPAPWLGVALHEGDANKFNLDTGALHRSDTHEGREHHRWLVEVSGRATAKAQAGARTKPTSSTPKPRPAAAPPSEEPDYGVPAGPDISPFTMVRIAFSVMVMIAVALRACH